MEQVLSRPNKYLPDLQNAADGRHPLPIRHKPSRNPVSAKAEDDAIIAAYGPARRELNGLERASSAPRHAAGLAMGPGGMGGAVAALSE